MNASDLVDRTLSLVRGELAYPFVLDDPADFIEQFVYDDTTGQRLRLFDEQRRVIRALTERDARGHFRYTMQVYSAPKKRGKTTVCAGIALWHAWRVPNGEIYIIGNDLKQAESRMYKVIEYACTHGVMADYAHVVRYKITLANGTTINAIPVDPTGEAGMNPTGLFWTETWGAKSKKHELLWTEAALSPTRQGQGFILVESYAGHVGESRILENLYQTGVIDGHMDATQDELYRNDAVGQITYWRTTRVPVWDNDAAYIRDEQAKLPDNEFRRIHGNQWVTSSTGFVTPAAWDACRGDLPPRDDDEVMVVALDAATSNDCFAVVGVTRRGDTYYVRHVAIHEPGDSVLDFDAIERTLYDPDTHTGLLVDANVVALVYDPYQLHQMAGRLRASVDVIVKEFSQGKDRLIADKGLKDIIEGGQIVHTGAGGLSNHVKNAGAKTDGDKLRIVKKSDTLKVDGAVALSMAVSEAGRLLIG